MSLELRNLLVGIAMLLLAAVCWWVAHQFPATSPMRIFLLPAYVAGMFGAMLSVAAYTSE